MKIITKPSTYKKASDLYNSIRECLMAQSVNDVDISGIQLSKHESELLLLNANKLYSLDGARIKACKINNNIILEVLGFPVTIED